MSPEAELESAMGYRFSSARLRDEALTHSSYTAENRGAAGYDRLEFLGDAVLQLAMTRFIYEAMPKASEGEMTLVRASVVSEPTLALVGKRWGVPDALRLGRGEELSGGREKESIISDAVEALLGVVYLETGFAGAEQMVRRHWAEIVAELAESPGYQDYKTRLQEVLIAGGSEVYYRVTEVGPQHAKEFTATVVSDGRDLATGTGSSKKRAEQEAARLALQRLANP